MNRITEHFYVIAAPNGLEDRYLITYCNGKAGNIRVEFGSNCYVSIAKFDTSEVA